MIVRVYETAKLDLETIGDMLWQADSQANFHPEARWIHSSSFGTEEPPTERLFREFSIKWIGREAIIMWLTSIRSSMKSSLMRYFQKNRRHLINPLSQESLLTTLNT